MSDFLLGEKKEKREEQKSQPGSNARVLQRKSDKLFSAVLIFEPEEFQRIQ